MCACVVEEGVRATRLSSRVCILTPESRDRVVTRVGCVEAKDLLQPTTYNPLAGLFNWLLFTAADIPNSGDGTFPAGVMAYEKVISPAFGYPHCCFSSFR